MTTNQWKFRRRTRRTGESGQALLFYILVMGTFLLGALLFAFDLSNMWFHRQAAQTAADAACAAGAMDLYLDSQGAATGHQGFTPGTGYSCGTGSTDSVCSYAAKNGYNSNNTYPGNSVSVSFPSSVIGCGAGCQPPAVVAAVPFIRVDAVDHVQTFFAGLLNGSTTSDVRAFSTCGAELATAPIPIVVLDPQSPSSTPAQAALNIQGNGTIAIIGGPAQSIQVNSADSSTSCGQSDCSVNLPWGSAKIDLRKGGPDQTGSIMGLWGAPSTAPSGFLPGTTGQWVAPSAPISDPFAQVCAPGGTGCSTINGYYVPATPTALQTVPTKKNGCVLYTAGPYPSGISVDSSGGGSAVAVFDPGLYYVTGGLALKSGSTVRPGTGTGDGSGGVTFYFAGSGTTAGTVQVDANSGKNTAVDAFNTQSGTGSLALGVACTGSSVIPSNVPATVTGNILLGPCTGYYGDPLGTSDTPNGEQRGFLFFQDRSGKSVDPSWGGGGQFLLAGTMYFHSCNSTGSGTGCGTAPTYFNDILSLNGNSGSGTYVLGSIVADNLTLGGTSGINMDLNPTKAYSILKVSILQ